MAYNYGIYCSMGDGAWPFLVGGVICLVKSIMHTDLDRLVMIMQLINIMN